MFNPPAGCEIAEVAVHGGLFYVVPLPDGGFQAYIDRLGGNPSPVGELAASEDEALAALGCRKAIDLAVDSAHSGAEKGGRP